MEYADELIAIALLWTIAAVIPGPNFLMIARTAAARSKAAAIRATLGIGVGTTIWGLAAFFGVHALFAVVPWLYMALKIVGGGYLVWLGVRLLWKSFAGDGEEAAAAVPALSGGAAFRLGLVTNLANPKSAALATSLFAATMPAAPPLGLGLTAVAVMAAISLVWYGFVASVFASRRVSGVYDRLRRWMDRVAGAIFAGFGTKLAFDD